jgi:predicted  nucleic acid-binding Zn ribbon protein
VKIYIAGRVTGEPIAECTMKFGKAQVALQDLGHVVVNPLQVVNNWQEPWQSAMRKCIIALMGVDAVLFLKDSQLSRGARLENHIAEEMGLKTFYNIQEIPKNEENTPY